MNDSKREEIILETVGKIVENFHKNAFKELKTLHEKFCFDDETNQRIISNSLANIIASLVDDSVIENESESKHFVSQHKKRLLKLFKQLRELKVKNNKEIL